ncbi:MAG: hypothetical protein ACOX87_15920 [Chloroflexota bacterium]|jgi:hypothetical protein
MPLSTTVHRPKTNPKKAKVTLALRADLVSFADKKAARLKSNRSAVIEELLAQDRAREEEELAAEGYKFFNREAVEFAEMSLPAVSEALFGEK